MTMMTRKLITSANQLIDGKQYELVEGDIIIRATFSEVVHPEPKQGYWITDDMEGAQFVSENHGGCIWWEDRQQLFDGLKEIGVKIYEL